ncbi:MAG: GNAT family N-acetyltransferase [Anaerolineae bacterium]|nr:GNAT family N-acetyltransferase [Anaerolineae bacterium]
MNLPPGYVTRAAQLDDAPAVLAIMHKVSLQIVSETDDTLEDVIAEWESPDQDLARDTRVVLHPDGRLVGYGIFYDAGHKEVPVLDIYVDPDEWTHDTTTAPYLFAWAEARALENLPECPADVRVALHAFTYSEDHWYQSELTRAGLTLIRHAFRMQIELGGAPEPVTLPDGFTLRRIERDDDWRPVLDCIRDAWRDHFGYIESPFDEHFARWQRHWHDHFTPDLWLAAMDGETVAGVCLCMENFNDSPGFGWVSTLAVRRAYRRRGLAMALLQTAFRTLYDKGSTRVGLGVDASSLTGATRLYERAGMSVNTRYDLFEKELRPGVDTTTREAGE